MLQQFLRHIERHKLCSRQDKILLAVSGGVDSVAMLKLFIDAGFTIGVVHCNFQLRGGDSHEDEIFVKQLAEQANIPVHVRRFQTSHFADQHKLSIQVAARELRYEFFSELLSTHDYQYVATAHHLNDSLETTLFNLVRGTGLDGLIGIPVATGSVIRPMLFATRSMIEDYVSGNKLTWREDVSNKSEKYSRNFIRHSVIPQLKSINPNLEESFRETQERLQGAWQMSQQGIRSFEQTAVNQDADKMIIDVKQLLAQPSPAWLLWELIKEFGFTYDQCRQTIEVQQSGKVFFAHGFQLTFDRQRLLLTKSNADDPFEIQITSEDASANNTTHAINCEIVEAALHTLTNDPDIGQFDADRVAFPLTWRSWRDGDQFVPLGMRHHKKISDFLIDLKVAMPEKSKVSVMTTNGNIFWVPGFRIADPFKVTGQTQRVLILRLHSKPQ